MGERPDVFFEAGRVRLTFCWKEDRYQHRVSIGGKTRRSVDAKSRHSPVFTDIHQQDGLAFLSGQGEGLHWSASVEIDASSVFFDIACRASKATPEIGSAYHGAGLAVEPAGDAGASCRPPAEDQRDAPAWGIQPVTAWGEPPCTLRYGYRIRPAD